MDDDSEPTDAPTHAGPMHPGTMAARIDAAHGPHGGDHVQIDSRFFGMNVADWSQRDYRPDPHPAYQTYLDALSPGVLRWPAGHTSQQLQWERSDADYWQGKLTPAHVDDFLQLAQSVGAEPLLAVNQKTGTPEQAADLVRYVNIEQGHGVTWWQIGNEPDHGDGKTSGPEEYAHDFVRFAQAMRAVDPGIRIVGGEIMSGAHIMSNNNARDWMTPILEIAGHEMDGIGWHYYPLDSNQPSTSSGAYPTTDNLFQEVGRTWRPSGLSYADEVFPHLHALRDQHAPGAGIWVTEIAEDSANGGSATFTGRMSGALWTADVMGRFAQHGPQAMAKFVFKSGSDHRYNLLDEHYEPRPAYYVYWLYARHYGHTIVDAQSEAREVVNVHASLREDGALTVMLVNKGSEEQRVRLDVENFMATRAERYDILADSLDAEEVRLNGERFTAENVREGFAPGSADPHEPVRVAPHSVTLYVLYP